MYSMLPVDKLPYQINPQPAKHSWLQANTWALLRSEFPAWLVILGTLVKHYFGKLWHLAKNA
jgi:hypothetical protein